MSVAERRHQEAAAEVDVLGALPPAPCAVLAQGLHHSVDHQQRVGGLPVDAGPDRSAKEERRRHRGNVPHPSARRAVPNTWRETDAPYERSVAVIGSGVSGLVAAYALSARDRVTSSKPTPASAGTRTPTTSIGATATSSGVDSAFLVHNDRTYPTLCRLFDRTGHRHPGDRHVDVGARRRERPGVRGSTRHRRAVPVVVDARPGPRYLLMLAEIKRFHAAATRLLRDGSPTTTDARRVPGPARLLPLLRRPLHDSARRGGVVVRRRARRCATRRATCSSFLEHHGMLSVFGSPSVAHGRRRLCQLRRGASSNRVDEVRAGVPGDVGATGRRRRSGNRGRRKRLFDAAVIATHPDQALLMLAEPTDAERAGARRDSVLHQPRPAAHRRIGAAAPSPGQGIVELSRHAERRQRAGHLRRHSPDAARRARAASS